MAHSPSLTVNQPYLAVPSPQGDSSIPELLPPPMMLLIAPHPVPSAFIPTPHGAPLLISSPSQVTTAQFNDLAVSKNTQAAISDVLGYANMTKVQEQSIPVCLTGAVRYTTLHYILHRWPRTNASLPAKSREVCPIRAPIPQTAVKEVSLRPRLTRPPPCRLPCGVMSCPALSVSRRRRPGQGKDRHRENRGVLDPRDREGGQEGERAGRVGAHHQSHERARAADRHRGSAGADAPAADTRWF